MSERIRLRPAVQEDYDWLRQLHHLALRKSVEAIWGWRDADQDDRFARAFDPIHVSIVEVAGQPAGMIEVKRCPSCLFLGNIQIMPAHQGKGIGSALIRDVQAQAAHSGLPVDLQVLRSNAEARRLYDRLGFVVVDENETRVFMRWTRRKGSAKPRTTPAP